jgi:hypothetical protein
LPEVSNVFTALIGATYLQTRCSIERTSLVARNLLYINEEDKFLQTADKSKFYNDIWNAKPYSKILRIHYLTDKAKTDEELYYKAYIQTLEIRRVKFKKNHSNRAHKFYKDL